MVVKALLRQPLSVADKVFMGKNTSEPYRYTPQIVGFSNRFLISTNSDYLQFQ